MQAEDIIQGFIFVIGISSKYLIGRTDNARKYGYPIGFLGQGFWIYTAYENNLVGVLYLAIIDTFLWCLGIWNHWKKPVAQNRVN